MRMPPGPRHSYCVRGLLAAGVLYWVLDASAGDRRVVDFVVIAALDTIALYRKERRRVPGQRPHAA